MARLELLALGVLGLICVSNALFARDVAANQLVAVTQYQYSGKTCSGYPEREVGPTEGCETKFGYSLLRSCDNSTGYLTYKFASEDCSGPWNTAEAIGVNQCMRYNADTTAFFCGKPVHDPVNFDLDPIPQPIPGDGNIGETYVECDYEGGQCPTDSPIKLVYDGKDCTGAVHAYVLFQGLQVGKCYQMIDETGEPAVNVEAIHQNGIISFAYYSSGCHGGKGAIDITAYPSQQCFNLYPGSQKVIVPA